MDVQLPDGTILRGVPDGMSKADLVAKLKNNGYDTSALEPAAVSAGKSINDIPRQFGLAARYGLEGLAGTAEIFSEPLRYATDRLTGSTGKTKPASAVASDFSDWLGLPKPQGADERTIGTATKLLAGSGGMVKGAQLLSKSSAPVIAEMGKFLAANPAQQLSSAAGAGLAGGASKEAGGSPLEQGVASFAGGVAGGFVPSAVGGTVNLAKTLFNKGMTVQEVDVKIGNILRRSGVDYNDVPERTRQALRQEMAGALQANKELDPAAVSRLLAFKEAGITPTRGMVSQNPVQITREQNLAKMGANSSDEGLSGLAMVQNQNNNKLIGNLNDLGANRGDVLRAGETVTGSILGTQAGLRGAEQSAWDVAKGLPGYKQPIAAGVLSDINAALDSEGLMPFMNPTISRYMEAFQTGAPFTPQAYKNLQSMLSKETMKGGNEGAAAALAARIMRNADILPAGVVNNGAPVPMGVANAMRGADDAATDAIDAVNRARNATRQAYAYEESSPLVRSVLSDGRTADPQRIAQSYIIGGTAREAEELIQQVGPQGMAPIKDAILSHLKEKALSGASDETGKFSQAAFTKALNALGERKLSLIFSPEELRALRNNARVASLMMSQPVGSAVNNSNSTAMLMGRGFDAFKALAGKLPFGQQLVLDPLQNISMTVGTSRAQNVLPGLLAEQPKQNLVQPYLLPGLAAGGLLASP
jgi:hypothetical protein